MFGPPPRPRREAESAPTLASSSARSLASAPSERAERRDPVSATEVEAGEWGWGGWMKGTAAASERCIILRS